MKINIKQFKTLFSRKNMTRIGIGSGILLFAALMFFLNSFFSPSTPRIKITSDDEFIGDSFTFAGTVTADCHCKTTLSLNDETVALDKEGNFEMTIDVGTDVNEWDYELAATTNGKLFNHSSEEKTKSGYISREEPVVKMEPSVSEWDQSTIDLSFEGLEGSSITVTTSTSYFVYKLFDDSSIELSSEELQIDESEVFSLTLPFENSERNRSTIYTVVANLDGYAEFEKKFEVKNLNFDEEKMQAEKTTWEEQEEIDSIVNSMDIYSGSGSVQIAIGDIATSRTIGTWYVLDPDNFQYVRIPVYVKNTGYLTAYVNPNYVTIIDEKFRTYSHDTATYYYTNYLDSIDLQPNTYTSGYLAFILPKDQHKFTVVYDDGSVYASKEIYVE